MYLPMYMSKICFNIVFKNMQFIHVKIKTVFGIPYIHGKEEIIIFLINNIDIFTFIEIQMRLRYIIILQLCTRINWLNNVIFFITYSINNFLLNFNSYILFCFIILAFIGVVLSEKCQKQRTIFITAHKNISSNSCNGP